MDCQNSLGMRVISPPLKKDYVNIYWINRVVSPCSLSLLSLPELPRTRITIVLFVCCCS